MSDRNLTPDERGLLEWLSGEDYSQLGECHGAALDRLVALGLAQIHEPGQHQEGFISQDLGHEGDMYRAVSVTPAGRALLALED